MKTKKPGSRGSVASHSNHSMELPRLRKIVGQLEGIEKMIRDNRYCPEIVQQVRAANSAVKALEVAIIKNHLNTCIKNSAKSDSAEAFNEKLAELLELIKG